MSKTIAFEIIQKYEPIEEGMFAFQSFISIFMWSIFSFSKNYFKANYFYELWLSNYSFWMGQISLGKYIL